jgi:tetratricopeptide (TPR) repeat protein
MPPGEWTWIEAYGLLETDPTAVHSENWTEAQNAVETALEQLIPPADLQAEFERIATSIDHPPAEILQRASGWGALERLRREAVGERPFCSDALLFDDDSLQAEQTPWLSLLRKGVFPIQVPQKAPYTTMVQSHWREKMEISVMKASRENWAAWLNLGLMRHYEGDREGARKAWARSLDFEETAWAARNLALLAMEDGDESQALDLFDIAYGKMPDLLPLVVEYGRVLIAVGRPEKWLAIAAELPESLHAVGRIRLLEAQAALAVTDLETVEQFFADQIVVADIREGETSLSDLWLGLHSQRLSRNENIPIDDALRARAQRLFPIPEAFDYRMVAD